MHETRNKLNYLIHTTFEKHHVLRDLLRFLTQDLAVFILLELKWRMKSKHFIRQLIYI